MLFRKQSHPSQKEDLDFSRGKHKKLSAIKLHYNIYLHDYPIETTTTCGFFNILLKPSIIVNLVLALISPLYQSLIFLLIIY